MTENSPTEPQLTAKQQVVSSMVAVGFRFVHELDELPLSYPDHAGLKQKAIDQGLADLGIVDLLDNNLYPFVEAPLLEYPEGTETKGNAGIDEWDKKMRGQFSRQGEEYEAIFEEVINNNKYRVGVLQNATTTIDFLPELLPDAPEVYTRVRGELEGAISDPDVYKNMSKEEKIRVIKKIAKGTELVLRRMNGQEISEEDFDKLHEL